MCCCRYIYWGQDGESKGIYQAKLDGSGRRLITNDYVEHPTGMTLGTQYTLFCLATTVTSRNIKIVVIS